jgi:hypothetical protein
MQGSISFLFGKETASRMRALDEALRAVENRHQAYFDSQPSGYASVGEARTATLAEFVQPHWRGSEPTLEFSPGLPPIIVAECLACVAELPTLAKAPLSSQRILARLRAFVVPAASPLQT